MTRRKLLCVFLTLLLLAGALPGTALTALADEPEQDGTAAHPYLADDWADLVGHINSLEKYQTVHIQLTNNIRRPKGADALTVGFDRTVCLDLNGCELSAAAVQTACYYELPDYVFRVLGNLTVTSPVNDGNPTGVLTGGKESVVSLDSDGVFTLAGGTIECGSFLVLNGDEPTQLGAKHGVRVTCDTSFTMSGGAITGGTRAENGVYVEMPAAAVVTDEPAVFTMDEGEIRDVPIGVAVDGVYKNGASNGDYSAEFTMNGGEIKNCSTDGVKLYGTAKYLYSGEYLAGRFTMTGGTISGCGTGVSVENTSLFTMSAGTISACSSYGVSIGGGGTFTMSDGTVSACASNVYLTSRDCSFALSGGTISGAVRDESGGGFGVEQYGGDFRMSGGTISDNPTGVYLSATRIKGENVYQDIYYYGALRMTGGEIRGNQTGVHVSGTGDNAGAFAMLGGEISGNEQDGVMLTCDYQGSESNFDDYPGALLLGGEISGNDGAGVYADDDGVCFLGFPEEDTVGMDVTASAGTLKEYLLNWYRLTEADIAAAGGTLINGNGGAEGCGVLIGKTGYLFMNAGTVSGSANGVWVEGSREGIRCILRGSPVFADNSGSDVYLNGDALDVNDPEAEGENYAMIVLAGALETEGISVAAVDAPTAAEDDARIFTVNMAAKPAESATPAKPAYGTADNFTSDSYAVTLADGEAALAYAPVEDITLTASPAELTVDETATLTVSFDPAYATDKDVAWSIEPADILSAPGDPAETRGAVRSFTVTGLKEGTATVTATAGEATASCTVTVKAKPAEDDGDNGDDGSWYYIGGGTTTYKVILAETENGTVKASQSTAAKGEKITLTTTPAAGYELESLEVKAAKAGVIEVKDGAFIMPGEDVTVTAKFKKSETETKLPFTDLDPEAWYMEGVKYVYEKGWMEGDGTGKFGPNEVTSRAMVAQILWKMAGQPKAANGLKFADVKADAWYADAVAWASGEGIVEGWTDEQTGERVFHPEDPVTREAFATMLYRFAKLNGQGFTGLWSFKLDFPDAGDVSPWAVEAMSWMVMNGVIDGMDGKLNPQGKCSRAMVATMITRYDKLS